MHAEQQAEQPVTAPEIASVEFKEDSAPIKKQRGGKRPGAGRKPDLLKRMIGRLTPATAREILATVDVQKVVDEIFQKGSLTLKQRTLADLMDRDPNFARKQAVSVSGTVHHEWTHDKYEHLSDEQLAQVIVRSLRSPSLPAPAINQNAPPIKPESKPEATPAIEAEIVDSETAQA